MSQACGEDVFAWANEQAARLRSGRLSERDIDPDFWPGEAAS